MYKINKNNYNKKLNIDNNKIYNILKFLENELNEIKNIYFMMPRNFTWSSDYYLFFRKS